ncbi:MAG: DMT family transporter [Candidatus Nanohaloarchaea archaeon]
MGPGVLLALVAALFSSLKGIARKHVARDFTSVEIGYIGQVYGSVLLFPFAAWRFTRTGIDLTAGVIGAVLVSTAIIVASTYLYIEALRITDVSVTEPIRNTSPIFVALIEPLILGIGFRTTLLGAAVLGSAGAYVLVAKDSLRTPLENLENRGALLSVLVAFILAVYSVAQRFGATNADPLLFIYITYVTSLIGFWIWKRREDEDNIRVRTYLRKDVFVLGTVTALGVVAGILAYSEITASQVTVVKQTSAIFSVVLGGKYFQEEDLARKLAGALVILAGVVLTVI